MKTLSLLIVAVALAAVPRLASAQQYPGECGWTGSWTALEWVGPGIHDFVPVTFYMPRVASEATAKATTQKIALNGSFGGVTGGNPSYDYHTEFFPPGRIVQSHYFAAACGN